MEKARNKEPNGFSLLGVMTMFDLTSIVVLQRDFIRSLLCNGTLLMIL
jgi:hypothetical protein